MLIIGAMMRSLPFIRLVGCDNRIPITSAGLALGTAILCCACHEQGLSGQPSFVGFVKEIHRDGTGGSIGTITVESHADKLVTKYVVTVSRETQLMREGIGGTRQIGFDALREKQWVKIWFMHGTSATTPGNAVAHKLLVVQRP